MSAPNSQKAKRAWPTLEQAHGDLTYKELYALATETIEDLLTDVDRLSAKQSGPDERAEAQDIACRWKDEPTNAFAPNYALGVLAREVLRLRAAVSELRTSEREELERLRSLINTPTTADYFEATKLEAAHQQERWGAEHDAGKAPEDWFWLLGYLGGKALHSFKTGDPAKGMHHIISSAAALLNWHRAATGEVTAMRPGIEAPSNERNER